MLTIWICDASAYVDERVLRRLIELKRIVVKAHARTRCGTGESSSLGDAEAGRVLLSQPGPNLQDHTTKNSRDHDGGCHGGLEVEKWA